jgi:Chaperonin GroEL (HSP60 family)
MGMGNAPILILREGTKRDKGKDAQYNNITAARAISDAVRSSLGPRGMDKMLVDTMGDVVITNDGVTILKEMDVQHPAAKMLVEVAKTQDAEVGDGTTTSVILAGELLKKATDMVDANVHPTIITAGYRLANEKAQEVLKKVSRKVSINDDKLLKQIAETSMISKQVGGSKTFFADMVVDAVKTIVDKDEKGNYTADLKNIQTVKKAGASMEESQLVKGLIIDKEPVSPCNAQESEECEDRARGRSVRSQEDRDRCEDPDYRPVTAQCVHPGRGEHAQEDGPACQGFRSQCRVLSERYR